MRLFDIIGLRRPDITPGRSKLHLATWNGFENPLDVFFTGGIERWQAWQGRKNFERPFIVTLVALSGRDRWLFVGCYAVLGRDWVSEPPPGHWSYRTTEASETTDLVGRLIVSFRRSGRASYLNAEGWSSDLVVAEMLPRRMSVGEFPGFARVLLTQATLSLIVQQDLPSWRAALSSVAGVYLITDTHTGRLYVGSATGVGGIWARWCQYAHDGHGGNVDLRRVIQEQGPAYARHFQYAVLEIADTHASTEEIVARESHWKTVLATRTHGYNLN